MLIAVHYCIAVHYGLLSRAEQGARGPAGGDQPAAWLDMQRGQQPPAGSRQPAARPRSKGKDTAFLSGSLGGMHLAAGCAELPAQKWRPPLPARSECAPAAGPAAAASEGNPSPHLPSRRPSSRGPCCNTRAERSTGAIHPVRSPAASSCAALRALRGGAWPPAGARSRSGWRSSRGWSP